MKTAISIPDEVFDAAEDVADELGVSRSQLYTRAVAELVARVRSEEVTRKLNEVYSRVDSSLDPVVAQYQYELLEKGDW